MAQFARPSADISVGGWTATPLWEKLDEVTPDDTTTEITSGNNPTTNGFEVRVTGITDPDDNTGHVVRARVKKNSSGGRQIDFTFTLVQGSTTIATWSAPDVTNAYETFTHNLTEGEAGNITDYSDLRVRVSANDATGSGPGRSGQATWIELEAPDAAAEPIDETVTGTAELSGIATDNTNADESVSGITELDGASEHDVDWEEPGTLLSLSGTVTEDVDAPAIDESVSGDLALSGSVDDAADVDEAVSGDASLSGASADDAAVSEVASSSLNISADVGLDVIFATPDSTLALSGQVTESVESPAIDETVNGAVSLSGDSIDNATVDEVASEAVAFEGSVVDELDSSEVEFGSLALSGQVTENVESPGEVEETVAGDLSLSGAEAHEVDFEQPATTLSLSGQVTEDVDSPDVDEAVSSDLDIDADVGIEVTFETPDSTIALSGTVVEDVTAPGQIEETVFGDLDLSGLVAEDADVHEDAAVVLALSGQVEISVVADEILQGGLDLSGQSSEEVEDSDVMASNLGLSGTVFESVQAGEEAQGQLALVGSVSEDTGEEEFWRPCPPPFNPNWNNCSPPRSPPWENKD
jgi:hypothetical protein